MIAYGPRYPYRFVPRPICRKRCNCIVFVWPDQIKALISTTSIVWYGGHWTIIVEASLANPVCLQRDSRAIRNKHNLIFCEIPFPEPQ
jgi:hypothetical protein